MSEPATVAEPGLGAAGPRPWLRDVAVVARIVAGTHAEGPGERTAVWVQGCSVHCPGCFNPHLWAFRGGQGMTATQLTAHVLNSGSSGLTLLGGEPFDQAGPLAEVARGVRASGRTVMTFTGYSLEQLTAAVDGGRGDVAALLGQTDLLVDGPYLKDRPDTARPWVGSTN